MHGQQIPFWQLTQDYHDYDIILGGIINIGDIIFKDHSESFWQEGGGVHG